MEILVTGGTGLLGRHLVDALLERGDSVRVLAFPTEDTSSLEHRGAVIHRGDIRNPETLVPAMRGCEGLFHVAALVAEWRSMADYRAINVTGTANVCRAALAEGVRRVVHVSSTSVYGLALGYPASESLPLAPFSDPYPVTKAEGEELVRRMIVEDDLPAAIVRPDLIFGPGDQRNFRRFADRLRSGRGIIIGSGDNALPLVYVTDVVQGLLLAFDHDVALGQVYNITNDRRLTQREFMEAIARAVGAPPPRYRIPYAALYAVGYAAERVARLTGSKLRPPTTRFGVAFLGTESLATIDKARRELGYSPQVNLHDGVRLAAGWYLQATRSAAVEPAVASVGDEVGG
ncbi:MAG TPA: NAD-dependent epimerase/dehydratase family protein [Thermoleophilaceae bacterium]|nr:NAD-dependent epimerase/dehydratase family protein [Thermoleophilaceae bacterium]